MTLLRERPLGFQDLDRGVALVVEAGWNQTVEDWRLMIEGGDAFGLETPAGELAATALVLPFDSRLAWISMVLVTQAWRRQGLGTRLLRSALQRVQAAGSLAFLDATEAGRAVYLPLGFRDLYGLTRRVLSGRPRVTAPPPGDVDVRAVDSADMAEIAPWDARRFGASRREVLAHLLGRLPEGAWMATRSGDVVGYCLARDGRVAAQIGPIVAETPDIAKALAARAWHALDRPAFIDVPDHQTELIAWLLVNGAGVQRRFTRMLLGSSGGVDWPNQIFASAGPELG